ncbi:Glycosyl hydrolases family 15 [Candidatus Kryptonium thompsonii]|uniref:Glycosyl hydrolases family 15 n=1 Tax=Candidatus Kryptonium thompsonii TaxID=1633631 RepID=A0A0N7MTR1_9BACT|nr:glycoside hydrolase family 15 protein [Candidatus Kryptonium thompsoni]CUS77571.1 Glycosyl hydrolases family 15 [Candidatus Kryptonium thompsoni]CUS78610.1 Glycosyl hydrolases family 15 [Candidatus Kryptonium thompsoni]CUS90947.1 Glycosyl hydrolases family 15 [Candidatus Kryptonium thompsoni]CUT02582.1 Glycosyl hydrolases family 15 [Candidatus Kryptonium thompsoni]CUT08054.1 Glycosyl hydrolases family 15 [Candidatus Kryptonium thompsoni]
MKKIFLLFFFLVSILSAQDFKLKLNLAGEWLFKTGDNLKWLEPEFDDFDWTKIKVPSTFESQGFEDYDGFVWYRLHFDVPRNLLNEDLILLLGSIDDADETYLNGSKIGETGKFPPERRTEWTTLRAYPVPKGLLKTKNNVIAVRVCDFGFDGGIFKGPIGLILKKDFNIKMTEITKPHRSAKELVSSNGLTAIVYSVENRKLISMYEHVYKIASPGNYTKNIIHDANFIVELDGKRYDLSEIPEDEVGYINGTNIIFANHKKLGVQIFYFAPFQIDAPVMVAICKINKKYRQSKIYFRANTIYGEITSEDVLSDVFEIQQLQIKKVIKTKTVKRSDGTGGEVEKRVFIAIPSSSTKEEIQKFSELTENDNILNDEIKFWNNFIKRANFNLENLTKKEIELFKQSLAVIKMAQCREKGSPYGQILASLPPGEWTYTWVRDGVYAINALIELGYFDEARAALEFMLKAKVGSYKNFIHKGKDYGVKKDYKITVCKYYGNGIEESDHNEDGPNIELDGFGLFLWTFGNYVEKSGDLDFAITYWDTVTTKIADVLISSIDNYGVIRAESGPWERHLPGKHYAYTTIAAIKGLRSLAKVAGLLKEKTAEKFYNSFADSILKSFLKNFVDKNGVIKGTIEAENENEFEYFDASVVEAINFDLIPANSEIARKTIEAIKKNLKIKNRFGFFRVNNGDWYDRQEWIFIDLRVAVAMKKSGFKKEAKQILDWITSQSNLNYNLIAELYDEFNSDYQGQYPMVGFGAGAYILGLLEIKR